MSTRAMTLSGSGRPLRVTNSDSGLHNGHGISPGTDGFNVAQPLRGIANQFRLRTKGILRVTCDVHPWMIACVGVVDHPFVAVTASDGTFEIPPCRPASTRLRRGTNGSARSRRVCASKQAAWPRWSWNVPRGLTGSDHRGRRDDPHDAEGRGSGGARRHGDRRATHRAMAGAMSEDKPWHCGRGACLPSANAVPILVAL